MECPACRRPLTSRSVAGVSVDVCSGGCGGVWFDRFELQKFDEPTEHAGIELLDIQRRSGFQVDYNWQIKCPRCLDSVLIRHFSSVKYEVEVDECPACGGYWLDVGELRRIRLEFQSEQERREAAHRYFQEVFGDQLAAIRADSQEQLARSRRITSMFRFICPSYYIPGKQEWGAF